MNVIVTLNNGLGVSLGPNFTLTTNVGTVVPNTATIQELLDGKIVFVDDSATQITVTSNGICDNDIVLNIATTTTTTTTSTTTTTTTSTTTTTTTTSTTTQAPNCVLVAGEFTTQPDCVLVAGDFIRS